MTYNDCARSTIRILLRVRFYSPDLSPSVARDTGAFSWVGVLVKIYLILHLNKLISYNWDKFEKGLVK